MTLILSDDQVLQLQYKILYQGKSQLKRNIDDLVPKENLISTSPLQTINLPSTGEIFPFTLYPCIPPEDESTADAFLPQSINQDRPFLLVFFSENQPLHALYVLDLIHYHMSHFGRMKCKILFVQAKESPQSGLWRQWDKVSDVAHLCHDGGLLAHRMTLGDGLTFVLVNRFLKVDFAWSETALSAAEEARSEVKLPRIPPHPSFLLQRVNKLNDHYSRYYSNVSAVENFRKGKRNRLTRKLEAKQKEDEIRKQYLEYKQEQLLKQQQETSHPAASQPEQTSPENLIAQAVQDSIHHIEEKHSEASTAVTNPPDTEPSSNQNARTTSDAISNFVQHAIDNVSSIQST